MPAHKGNKYNEKYTRNDVVEKLNSIVDGLYNSTFPTYTHALLANRLYPQLVDQWMNTTYKNDAEVIVLIKQAKGIAPSALYRSTCDQTIQPTAGLFGLKAQYGWVEKGVQLEAEATKSVLKIVSVKPDGTRIEQ